MKNHSPQNKYLNLILQAPNRKLYQSSAKIFDFKEAEMITNQLIKVIENVDKPFKIWLGLSAPQIGYNKRIILLKESKSNYKIMINPEILKSRLFIPTISKCFSLKGVYLVTNPIWIKVKYQDLKGKNHISVTIGGKATVLQHEIDHLNGVLISNKGVRIL